MYVEKTYQIEDIAIGISAVKSEYVSLVHLKWVPELNNSTHIMKSNVSNNTILNGDTVLLENFGFDTVASDARLLPPPPPFLQAKSH